VIIVSYIVITIFIIGFLYKIWLYASTPSPLKIPTTPAATSALDVGKRLTGEVVFFKSLFKSNKWIWLGGYLFHIAFLLIILRHIRYFIYPVPDILLMVQPIGIYAGIFIILPILYLLLRRLFVDRVRYISKGGDFIILFLLLAIIFSGILLKFFYRADLIQVKAFIIGLLTFNPSAFPYENTLFLIHFSLVLGLLLYFPFSKLIHAGGIFFSPTLNQIDNSREKRHVV